mgnify:CR=1 FL=1
MTWKDTIKKEEGEKYSTMPKGLVFEWEWYVQFPNMAGEEERLKQKTWSKDSSTLFISNNAHQLNIQKGIDALNTLGVECFVADLINKNIPDDWSGHLHFGVAVKAKSRGKEVILYFNTDTEAYWAANPDVPEIENIHLPFELTDPTAFTALVMNRLGFNVGIKHDDRMDEKRAEELSRQLRNEEISYSEYVASMNEMGANMDRGFSQGQLRAEQSGHYY